MQDEITELSANTARVLDAFVASCREAFGGGLKSIVLYGSAAEGRQRSTSDVNLLVLLESFEARQVDAIREPLRTAQAAIQLRVMFLLERELREAASAFADKFADMTRRKRVLHGEDPFASLSLVRRDEVLRLRQTLLNLVLRLRLRYVSASLRDEQAALALADMAGPLRVAAAEWCALSGKAVDSPKTALDAVIAELPSADGLSAHISAARERTLEPGRGAAALLQLLDVAEALRARALALPEQ